MVFIDQEGGLVRRLKESSASAAASRRIQPSFAGNEARNIDCQLCRDAAARYPLNSRRSSMSIQSDNPNIGKDQSALTPPISGKVKANALLASEIRGDTQLGLCLKHFRIGGRRGGSHQEFMDISDALHPEQEALFYALAPGCSADAGWSATPSSGMGQRQPDHAVRRRHRPLARPPSRHLDHTADMQMQGLQKALGTRDAVFSRCKPAWIFALYRQQPAQPGTGDADIAGSIEQGLQTEPGPVRPSKNPWSGAPRKALLT